MDILRDLVYMKIIGRDERHRLRKNMTTLEIPDSAFSSDSILCRVEEWGPECKYGGNPDYYKKGDIVMVPKTMQIPKGRGIFVNEEEILAVVEPS